MRTKPSFLTGFSLILASVLLLAACGSEPSSSEDKTEVLVRPVKLIEIGQTKSDDFLNFPAVIKSAQHSTLSFEVGGVLKELLVVEAQEVKQGEVLAKLDQRDLQTQLKSATAEFDNANTEYQRAVRLMKEDAIARSSLEERKSKLDVRKAQLETAQKALQDSVLIAPYDGNIARIHIKKRQAVQAGAEAISIIGEGKFQVSINLPSSVIARADKSQSPTTDSYIILDSSSDRRIPIAFKEVSLEADAASQTYEVVFTFDAPEDLIILPGMNAVVWFRDPGKLTSENNKIRIPLTAIATDGDQKYVWIVDQNTLMVSKRNIVIEANVGTLVGVINGLKPGETIVASGVSALSEGMKVSRWSK
ncbi:MAG: efflux RND transporter periplasmic adaptor subunit [Pseudomonadales bacterium]|nr:efflux RND transporter periplasmic adaptor subunit [Pseudomonadales bacterium]